MSRTPAPAPSTAINKDYDELLKAATTNLTYSMGAPAAKATTQEDVQYPSALENLWDLMNKYHIIEFEQNIQNKIINFFKGGKQISTDVLPSTVQAVVAPPAPSTGALFTSESAARSIDVPGFYQVTGPEEVTFYVTTTWPGFTVKTGWTIVGVSGLIGNLRVSSDAVNAPGAVNVTSLTVEPYNWKFTLQSDTEQLINETRYATGALMYPPGQEQYPSQERSGPAIGYYAVVQHVANFFFTSPAPQGTQVGWYIVGLPTLGPCRIESYSESLSADVMNVEQSAVGVAWIKPIDGSIPEDTGRRIYVKGGPAMVVEPKFDLTLHPIEIGDGVWVGAQSTILPGAQLKNMCVITAGSVIKGIIPVS